MPLEITASAQCMCDACSHNVAVCGGALTERARVRISTHACTPAPNAPAECLMMKLRACCWRVLPEELLWLRSRGWQPVKGKMGVLDALHAPMH